MPLVECPRCHRIVIHSADNTDYVHECDSGIGALDNEDVVIVGDWEDYTGSGTETKPMMRGKENRLWGTKASRLGAPPVQDVTSRGNSESTRRTRQHLEHFETPRQ